jgi:hypothetical protein
MRSWLVFAVFSGMLMCAADKNHELRVHVSVPGDVAAQAARNVAGEPDAPAPILMLHGLEFGANEGFKIEVLGESPSGISSLPVLLAVTGVVGHPQSTPQTPLRKIDLPVPLNDKAAAFLANRSEVIILLRFERTGADRPPVKIDRVFIQGSAEK